ncbi:tRNA modification GTPase MnmE [Salvia divinorum]|uniref:tRNA modification GTPase MnmE n=1 Tax=Salvia divinorum TaxID=28513 RepID=A0ABD1G8X8_SALDI
MFSIHSAKNIYGSAIYISLCFLSIATLRFSAVLVFSQPLTPFHRNLSLLFSASHKFPTLRPLAFAKEENTLVLNKDERFGGWRSELCRVSPEFEHNCRDCDFIGWRSNASSSFEKGRHL